MKRLIIPILLLLSSPAWATFALVQHPCNAACAAGGTTCVITLTSTIGTGNLLVFVGLEDGTGGTLRTISSISGGGSFVSCATCGVLNGTVGYTSAGYVLSSTTQTTSVTVTMSGTVTNAWRACVREYTASSPVLNTGATPSGSRNQSTNTLTPADVTLTLSANNGLVVQFGTMGGTASALATYGNCDFPNGNGVCDKLNTTSGASQNWTQAPTGMASLGAIAFEESGGAPAKKCTLALMGTGPC